MLADTQQQYVVLILLLNTCTFAFSFVSFQICVFSPLIHQSSTTEYWLLLPYAILPLLMSLRKPQVRHHLPSYLFTTLKRLLGTQHAAKQQFKISMDNIQRWSDYLPFCQFFLIFNVYPQTKKIKWNLNPFEVNMIVALL